MTYDNRPVIDGAQVGSFNTISAGVWLEFDVGGVITGPGVYSFGTSQASGDNVTWASRETKTTGLRPQLIIITE